MLLIRRRWLLPTFCAACLIVIWYQLEAETLNATRRHHDIAKTLPIHWKKQREHYPVTSFISLPTGVPIVIPKIQRQTFDSESPEEKSTRESRLQAVVSSFQHSWAGYKEHAWLQDELAPVSGTSHTSFGGWGATLFDTLDTLWILGMRNEFEDAVRAVGQIDFTILQMTTLNLFETTIRYLGGLLGAYDVSEGKYDLLLKKAVELGEILYAAFDTPNRMPVTRWDWTELADLMIYLTGKPQVAHETTLVAEIGSLSLEFTRLSQLTNDPKYFDAIQRITDAFDEGQNKTLVPGMWPIVIDAAVLSFTKAGTFTLGGMADSLYEYLPKQHLMLGGLTPQYRNMYRKSLDVIKRYLLFRPLTKEKKDILFSGDFWRNALNHPVLEPKGQHLTCFTGGMVGIGARIFETPEDLVIARKLVDGCIWAYESQVTGLMPEVFYLTACRDPDHCEWEEVQWHKGIFDKQKKEGETSLLSSAEEVQQHIQRERLEPGFTKVADSRYILRPEAIESIFVLYRITGDETLRDAAWRMFQAIEAQTHTDFANAAISDVTRQQSQKFDSMESFWLAETLKYFYLIFSDPNVVSLDEYVLFVLLQPRNCYLMLTGPFTGIQKHIHLRGGHKTVSSWSSESYDPLNQVRRKLVGKDEAISI
ncbi:MAG: hypothetical protein M1835_005414 [Candelina submexicana]|nr:MAG: hypothetical protein M1835_005414 [Candelina submexicana]